MYKYFYKLTENPFELSPDPRFFYPTARHNEALASLRYGVENRKGFVVLTGEVGTGKTLLVRCLLDWMNRSQIPFSYVFNTRLSPRDFLQYCLSDLGLQVENKGKGEMIALFTHYLIDCYRRGSTAVLVIDEAQLLEREVLEEIRLLSNLETTRDKLLQILLIGQPELDRKLDSTNLRQLKQRIAFRCRLEPLSREETCAYVLRRLEIAAGNSHGAKIFSPAAIDAIYRYSRGIPRLINSLCENSLIAGVAGQMFVVTPDIVEEIAGDFRLDVSRHPWRTSLRHESTAILKKIFRSEVLGKTLPRSSAISEGRMKE